jgi:4a-hydroxytetrahydrobiopterin dehydratase
VPLLSRVQAEGFLCATPHWSLNAEGLMIHRNIAMRSFAEAMSCLNKIAEIAENEGHHPDLHLTDYCKVRIDLTTHAIGGLSENDFVLAAKIDQLLDRP